MYGIELLPIFVPLIVGLTEVVKQIGLSSKYSALVSLVFGLLLTFLLPGEFTKDVITLGLVSGLAASGLWSGVKNGLQSTKLIK